MSMVRGIDGGFLLGMLRAGREDRAADDKRRAAEEAAMRRESLLGRMFTGGGQTGGVAGQYAPSRPAREPSFGEAFGADTLQAMESGQALPELPAAQQQMQPATRPARMGINQDAYMEFLTFDPETANQIASAIAKYNEYQLKQFSAKNDYMGAAAKFVMEGATPQERQQRFNIARDQLLQVGWTEQELDGVDDDLSDERLMYYQATAIDFDKMIDNQLEERKFREGKTESVPEGGALYRVRPGQQAEALIVPNPGGMQPGAPAGGANIPPEAIAALRAGQGSPEQFDEIFGPGAAARVMGGGSGNAAGNFPGAGR